MFTAFNIKFTNNLFGDKLDYFISLGKKRQSFLEKSAKDELNKYTLSDGTIDGSSISKEWFKIVKSDIFISHSHNDEYLAYALTGWLMEEFCLDVFLDETVWNSADSLLKELDDKKCKRLDGYYSYEKRNLSTSHVHVMLSMAIFHAMDNAESIFFINTTNSIPDIDSILKEDSSYTTSPWLYEELTATKLLRRKNYKEQRYQTQLETRQKKIGSIINMAIAYEVPLDNLTELSETNLREWLTIFKSGENTFNQFYNHALDYLYKLVYNIQIDN